MRYGIGEFLILIERNPLITLVRKKHLKIAFPKQKFWVNFRNHGVKNTAMLSYICQQNQKSVIIMDPKI